MSKDEKEQPLLAARKEEPPSSSPVAKNGKTDKNVVVLLQDAPPPWHSVAIIVVIMACAIQQLPRLFESLDQVATIDVITSRKFPSLVSVKALGWIRLCMSLCIWLVTIQKTWFSSGSIIATTYLPKSKLQIVRLHMKGIKTQYAFTCWCWNLLGLCMTFTSMITLAHAYDLSISLPPWIYRVAIVSWETAAPQSLLVSAVVKYGIWPKALATHGNTASLRSFHGMMQHNGNSIMVIIECALLGNLPVRIQDIVLPTLWGSIFYVFAWSIRNTWNNIIVPEDKTAPYMGSQFLYFFLDTTLGRTSSIAILVLETILLVFYAIFVLAEKFLSISNSTMDDDGNTNASMIRLVLQNTVIAFVLCSLVCRFRD